MTPVFLILILAASIFKPKQDWGPYLQGVFSGEGSAAWEPAGDGLIGKLFHQDLQANLERPDLEPEARQFYESLKTVRNIDRLVLVGTFLGLAYLVHRAWARHRTDGKA